MSAATKAETTDWMYLSAGAECMVCGERFLTKSARSRAKYCEAHRHRR